MTKEKSSDASDKDEIIRRIEERKKEIDTLRKIFKKLSSSSTNSFIKNNSK
ncbi:MULTISPECIES: hypothetical protein [Flammeovirga]|uniref:Uncharacterized protein n=1 Tax=Flammeovirga agarivorans TaxID=2726742 RepID=A0A7X8SKJ6_9BACT|nr:MULTISPECIES: hypothetical protein [Flammeovirga]NLR91929.1 hypothetical protein [Flammeovirga agarivorans]